MRLRVRKLGLRLICLAALGVGSAASCCAADTVMRPSHGVFPAYPAEDAERGFHPYAFADFVVDDNLFRLSDQADTTALTVGFDSPERSDRFARLGAGLRADVEKSRQQFRFDGSAYHYSFDHHSTLNRWLYAGDADWLWTVGSQLQGDVGYARSRAYPDFSELQFASDDIVTRQYAHLSANWKALSRMEIRTLFEKSQFDHDNITRAELDNRVSSGTLGLFYVGPTQTAIGVQHKVSSGDYPHRQTVNTTLLGTTLVDNGYRQTESSLVIQKIFDAKIGADLRVGYTRRRHNEVTERDFSGTTGRAQLRYAPTAKVLVDLAVYRELQAIEDLAASYANVRGASITPAWAPTSKTVLQASYSYARRVLAGNPGFILSDTPAREDRIRISRITFGYQPSRRFDFTLSYEHGARSSTVDNADYDYKLGALHAVVSF